MMEAPVIHHSQHLYHSSMQQPAPHSSHGNVDEFDIDDEFDEQLLPVPQSWIESAETENGDHHHHPPLSEPSTTSIATTHFGAIPVSHTTTTSASCLTTTPYRPDEEHFRHPRASRFVPNTDAVAVGSPYPSPSWQEISSEVLPAAARELLSSSLHRVCYTARVAYARGHRHRQYSDMGNPASGYYRPDSTTTNSSLSPAHVYDDDDNRNDASRVVQPAALAPFSSLPWVERQMVQEWRTYHPSDPKKVNSNSLVEDEDEETTAEEDDFARARTLVPMPLARPPWQRADACHVCRKPFGPTRLRHHCRLCGASVCHPHSEYTHPLPHLGYDPQVPERVCTSCKTVLLEQNLAERVAWRLARCRDLRQQQLKPYFQVGVDTLEDAALRVTKAAISMAKSIPLGAQATVAVETVDVLRKHGLNGIYTIMLRQEFLAAADMLRKALGINRTAWPLSVHELSAAIFYALAQHRAVRGLRPEEERMIHTFKGQALDLNTSQIVETSSPRGGDVYDMSASSSCSGYSSISLPPRGSTTAGERKRKPKSRGVTPVCEPVSENDLRDLIFYAPLALNFIYCEKEVDAQLLAAQQGWRLLYAHLEQDHPPKNRDRPASALFVHEGQKLACLAIRGTATIHDVVTDIRQVPVPFPDLDDANNVEPSPGLSSSRRTESGWTTVSRGQGLAVSGMAGAALNLYLEHIDCILQLAEDGYNIRITGHSLGGGVASLLGVLVHRDLKQRRSQWERRPPLRVFAYGTPACIDARLADFVEPMVVTAVLHDDVVPRLTPMSCRGLLKHLLHIRDTWVKEHLQDDLMAITERAQAAWAPRWREGFTLATSSSSLKRYCRKQLQYSKRTLMSMTDKLRHVADEQFGIKETNPVQTTTSQRTAMNELNSSSPTMGSSGVVFRAQDDEEPRVLVDYIGGADGKQQINGSVVDGDEFFEADDDLVESEETQFEDAVDRLILAEQKKSKKMQKEKGTAAKSNPSEDEGPGAVVLEESPLPRLYIPGRIMHIYSHRGVYRAAIVPRNFRELRRITLAGNMLSDHKTKSYYEALLEVRSVLDAPEDPPRWTPFDQDDTCSCCASRFTWASTSSSKAQEARDKHNCRSCGSLVCDPCSSNRIPLPSIGLTVCVRVCDRCYHDIDGILTSPSRLPGARDGASMSSQAQSQKPERQRERRSVVVDELASQVKLPGSTP